ncbi:hypothetical protein [Streptomyces sp. NPDC002215]|uniref:hypothetical protein n=1 Tax=Streptomyces sp. NPDC002215 TaxID=3154412 RepID=UPI00331EFB0B
MSAHDPHHHAPDPSQSPDPQQGGQHSGHDWMMIATVHLAPEIHQARGGRAVWS